MPGEIVGAALPASPELPLVRLEILRLPPLRLMREVLLPWTRAPFLQVVPENLSTSMSRLKVYCSVAPLPARIFHLHSRHRSMSLEEADIALPFLGAWPAIRCCSCDASAVPCRGVQPVRDIGPDARELDLGPPHGERQCSFAQITGPNSLDIRVAVQLELAINRTTLNAKTRRIPKSPLSPSHYEVDSAVGHLVLEQVCKASTEPTTQDLWRFGLKEAAANRWLGSRRQRYCKWQGERLTTERKQEGERAPTQPRWAARGEKRRIVRGHVVVAVADEVLLRGSKCQPERSSDASVTGVIACIGDAHSDATMAASTLAIRESGHTSRPRKRNTEKQ